jgi:aminopeptidase
MDPRVQAMADILVNYSVAVRPGDWVVIQTTTLGEALADACARAVFQAGGNPTVLLGSEELQETKLREAGDEQLSFVSPLNRVVVEQADVTMLILAPTNTRVLSNADPARIAVQSRASEPLMETQMRRAAEGSLRWTIAQYPTQAAAQDAGMSLRGYEDFVYAAGLVHQADPVEAWKALGKRQEHVVEWLSDKQTVHIAGPGTDLTLSIAGRTWISDDGHENFPGGEVFTGPVEDSVNGVIQFNFPAYLRGREVTRVRLDFKDGVVVDASAGGDGAFLHQMLDLDEGARRLGEFAFGTNPGIQSFTKNTLFDEKIGGTLHMALGRAYPETGGRNISALHW